MHAVYNNSRKFNKLLPRYTGYFIMYEKITDFYRFFGFGPSSGGFSKVYAFVLYEKYDQLIWEKNAL